MEKEFIISLTSWKGRINVAHKAIESLLNQTEKADRIVLNLSIAEFPKLEEDLPKSLRQYIDNGSVELYWVFGNSYSYKKVIPTLERYPNAIVCSADDDVIYKRDFVQKQKANYKSKPSSTAISTAPKFYKHYASGCGGSVYERKHFGDFIQKLCRSEVFVTNQDDLFYGVLLNLNGLHFSYFNYNGIEKTYSQENGKGRLGAYKRSVNEPYIDKYLKRRFNVSLAEIRKESFKGVGSVDNEPNCKDDMRQVSYTTQEVMDMDEDFVRSENERLVNMYKRDKENFTSDTKNEKKVHTVSNISSMYSYEI